MSGKVEEAVAAENRRMIGKYLQPGTVPEESLSVDSAESRILAALDGTIDGLHWVGHNVIYAAISLAALHELGGGLRHEAADIAELVSSFAKTIPGRSWIGYSAAEVKRLTLDEHDGMPEITDGDQLSAFILNELATYSVIYRAEAHHDLMGHMLTYSHALNILYDLGHHAYFRRGLPGVLKIAKVLRASRQLDPEEPIRIVSPVDRLPLVEAARSSYLPDQPEYWASGIDGAVIDWDFGHLFKFPYSFYHHWNRVSEAPAKAMENFRYIIHPVQTVIS
ncbi:hypothetical protein [Paenibacillus lautus]|uniref:hypothetical protein n=1 Tax=Paenibacillus lautus TaxID=1401 RepID=UPI002DB885E6|nr:hypothetical protein [Paenibacillus lautus]MEC0253878.1 hypothetical protein [Paenibacillus lautus]